VSQLRSVLESAQSNGAALGHFNISDWILLKAVFASANELKVPVIVGASEGERALLGVAQIAALVKSLREKDGFPIFLNADHTHSLESAIAAAKAGFDSIVYDLSALPFEENDKQTKEAVEALRSINPSIPQNRKDASLRPGSSAVIAFNESKTSEHFVLNTFDFTTVHTHGSSCHPLGRR